MLRKLKERLLKRDIETIFLNPQIELQYIKTTVSEIKHTSDRINDRLAKKGEKIRELTCQRQPSRKKENGIREKLELRKETERNGNRMGEYIRFFLII